MIAKHTVWTTDDGRSFEVEADAISHEAFLHMFRRFEALIDLTGNYDGGVLFRLSKFIVFEAAQDAGNELTALLGKILDNVQANDPDQHWKDISNV